MPIKTAWATISVTIGFCACSASVGIGPNEISRSDLESQVARQLAAQVHQPVPRVVCPGPLPAQVGASVDCTLTAQGSTISYPVKVVVENIDHGRASFTAQVGTRPTGHG